MASCVFVLQAKDKDHWVRLFSQFCSKTANEEEEIVHKLLGDKFKVGFLPWPLSPTLQVACGVWATFRGLTPHLVSFQLQ